MIRRLKSEKPTDLPNPELEELQEKLSEAEAELSGYRSIQDITEVEIRELKKQLAEAEAKIAFANASVSAEDTSLLKDLLAARDREVASLRAAGAGNGEDEALRKRAQQADYLFGQLEAARSTISLLEQQMLNQPHISQAAFDEATQRVRQLEAELNRSHMDFDRSEELRRKVEADKAALAEEVASLNQQLKSSQDDFAAAEALKAEVEELSIKLAGREQTVTELRKELSTVTGKLVAAQAELDDVRRTRQSADAEVQSLKDEISNLKYELGESRNLQSKLAAATVELEAHEDLKQAKHQLQDRVGHLEGELLEAKNSAQEADALRRQVAYLEAEAATARDLKDDLDYIRSVMADAISRLNESAAERASDLPSFLAPLPRSA